MKKYFFAAICSAFVGMSAQAATINIIQSGDDVIVTAEGSLNLGGLTYFSSGGRYGSGINASIAAVGTGPALGGPPNADVYYGFGSFPTSFGSGDGFVPTTGSSSGFSVRGDILTAQLYVPTGYVSGTNLSGSSSYAGATLDSLGLTRGTYNYVWSTDRITLSIGTPVPPLGPPPPGCIPSNYRPKKCAAWRPSAAPLLASSALSADLPAVPLPAPLPLLAFGLASLGFMARRKRKSA